jgi:hypothetical protein
MKNFSIALQYNRWLLVGWICFLPGLLGLGGSCWEFVSSLDNYSAASIAASAIEKWFWLSAFSAITIILTANGFETLRVYRIALRRLEYNVWARSHHAQPLPFPWDIESLSRTYCARAGVRAAACRLHCEGEMPRGYMRWWRIIDTRQLCTRLSRRTD